MQQSHENLKKDSREVAHSKTDLVPKHAKNESIATYLSTNKAEEKNIIENDITWVFLTALLHKDLKVKTSHIYSNLSDNSGMW
ncbi:hypothetical protein ABTN47_16545, partial [Acinetobacter baumannii]